MRERVNASGAPVVALTDAAIDEVARSVVARAPPAGVAICFLHSYANPDHEQRVARALRAALPDTPRRDARREVWPEMREYERAMTTVICALRRRR